MPQIRISEEWFRGLKAPERENFRNEVLSAKNVLDKLQKILYNIEESKREVRQNDYDNPSWSHKQAHINGELDMLDKISKLIAFTERDDPPAP